MVNSENKRESGRVGASLKKYFSLASIPMLALALMAGCKSEASAQGEDTQANNSSAAHGSQIAGSNKSGGDEYETTFVEYKNKDLEESFDIDGSTLITGNGDSIDVEGQGAHVSDSTVTISTAGTYILSGTIDDGQIIIDAGKESDVRLVLNGVDISCLYSSPIYGVSSDKIIITIAGDTVNNLSDGSSYVYENEGDDEPNAVIFSKDDLTVNGTGTLNITANYNHGVRSKDDLKIVSGNINITAVGDGLKGKDSVCVKDGNIIINSGADGIKSSNDTDEGKGYIVIEGGSFDITAACDGIQAVSSLELLGGSFDIKTGGGSGNASTESGSGRGFWDSSSSAEETSSAKGLKSDKQVYISGGVIGIDSADDSIHSNGDITVDGGAILASSGDDGMHADNVLTVNSGDIDIQKSYEGIEGLEININGGDISIVSSDDGLNAAGGDGSSVDGRKDMNQFAATEGAGIIISGGTLYINAGGDGIDSNGDLYVSGGTTVVNGPTDNSNGALDYNGEALISGGTVVAFGSSGMIENFGNTSSQNVMLIYFGSGLEAGTIMNISDSGGATVLSASASKPSQCVIVSSPELKTGETYVVSTGGSVDGEDVSGFYGSASYSGGTEICTLTIDGVITSNGSANGSGPGGFGGGRGSYRGEKDNGEFGGRGQRGSAAMPDGRAPGDGTAPEIPEDGML